MVTDWNCWCFVKTGERDGPFISTTKGVCAEECTKERQQKKGVMVEGNNEQNKVEFGRQPWPIVRSFRMGETMGNKLCREHVD